MESMNTPEMDRLLARNQELEQENRELKEENAILKDQLGLTIDANQMMDENYQAFIPL